MIYTHPYYPTPSPPYHIIILKIELIMSYHKKTYLSTKKQYEDIAKAITISTRTSCALNDVYVCAPYPLYTSEDDNDDFDCCAVIIYFILCTWE